MENVNVDEKGKEVVPKQQRDWAMFIHFSSFAGYFSGIGFILAPLVMWLIKKEGNDFIDHHGKEAVNFQINLFIHGIIVFVLCFVLIGFLFLPVLLLSQAILAVVAGVKASEGVKYRYPLIIRFIK